MKRGLGNEEIVTPELAVPLRTICFIIIKAREFEAKEGVSEPNPGSNPTDDREIAVLQDHGDDPVGEELIRLIRELSEDAQSDLVGLMWLGRDGSSANEWADIRRQAAEAHTVHTAEYLCGNPLLADHLAAGLELIGLSCTEYENEHL